jgi:hypothetical protein
MNSIEAYKIIHRSGWTTRVLLTCWYRTLDTNCGAQRIAFATAVDSATQPVCTLLANSHEGSRLMTTRFLLAACTLLAVGGCDALKPTSPRTSGEKYSACLASAVGTSNLSLDNIRSLCAEASGVIDVSYSYDKSGVMLPLNDFTRCYEKEKKELEAKGVAAATRVAKLSCKYPEVQ